jgi:hypothetical protein
MDEVKNTNKKEIFIMLCLLTKALRYWSFNLGWSIE